MAKQFYHDNEWAQIQGDKIDNDELAATLLSFATVDGTGFAVEMLQKILGVSGTGYFGPVTLAHVNAANVSGSNLAASLRTAADQHFKEIVMVNPADLRFLAGWLNRADAVYPNLP